MLSLISFPPYFLNPFSLSSPHPQPPSFNHHERFPYPEHPIPFQLASCSSHSGFLDRLVSNAQCALESWMDLARLAWAQVRAMAVTLKYCSLWGFGFFAHREPSAFKHVNQTEGRLRMCAFNLSRECLNRTHTI